MGLLKTLMNTRIAGYKGFFFFSASLQGSNETSISSRCVAQRYLGPQQSFAIVNLNQQGSQLSLSLVPPACALTFYSQVHLVPPSASKPL